MAYLNKWEDANIEMLDDVGLGKSLVRYRGWSREVWSFVFLSILAAWTTMPLLQTVYQADAANMNFGNYSLYSYNGIIAKCNVIWMWDVVYGALKPQP